MHNVSHEVKGDKLLITVDISAATVSAAPRSASGKTKLVGSTGGAVSIQGGLTYSLNIMAK